MITFFSNFINEHQIPFCEAMYKKTNGYFRFVATEPMAKERLDLGFKDRSDKYPYVIRSYESNERHEESLRLGAESDVVIIGSAPDEFILERLKANKLTFRYHERFFKEGKWRILDPRVFLAHYKQDFRYRNKNLHMLCASAYTAPDCRFILSYPNKTYKWGYFPETNLLDYETLKKAKKDSKKAKILWVSRFIKLKHPEEIIRLAKRLKESNYSFEIEMIGIGELREKYEKLIAYENLSDSVQFSGPFSPSEVLNRMKSADIFLFTSDRNEGWGAVLNESMSAGCAVVACNEIGSVPYLIKHGENGLIYNKKDKDSLFDNVRMLIENKDLRIKIQKNAYETIKNVWNAEVATDRLLHLIDCIKNSTETPYASGPCSRD